jgi:hypothetical protein
MNGMSRSIQLESKLNNPYKKIIFYSKADAIVPDAKGITGLL